MNFMGVMQFEIGNGAIMTFVKLKGERIKCARLVVEEFRRVNYRMSACLGFRCKRFFI